MMARRLAQRRADTIVAIVAALAALLVPISAAPAQTAGPKSPDLQNIERDLERSREASENLARQAEEVRIELRLLKGRMISVARKTLDLESELSAIEARIAGLEEIESGKSEALRYQRRQLGRTLGALQRIALLPPEALVAAPGSPLDAVRSATLLQVAVPAIEKKAHRLKQDLDELDSLRVRIEQERAEVNAAGKQLVEERKTLVALIDKKRRLQSRTAEQQTATERRMSRLAREAGDLRDLIRKIEREAAARERAEREAAQREQERRLAVQRAQKRQLERERQRASASEGETQGELQSRLIAPPDSAAGDARPAARSEARTAPDPKTPTEPDERQVAIVGTSPTAPLELEKPANVRTFPTVARNELLMPAHGLLLRRYGEQLEQAGEASKGIIISTRNAAQVIAPFDGRVVYAGQFRGYGLILIIEHGKRYHTLLAGLERVDAVVGQWILAGEPIGIMTGDGVGRPELYLELRRNGQPINPLPWLAATGDKVRG